MSESEIPSCNHFEISCEMELIPTECIELVDIFWQGIVLINQVFSPKTRSRLVSFRHMVGSAMLSRSASSQFMAIVKVCILLAIIGIGFAAMAGRTYGYELA